MRKITMLDRLDGGISVFLHCPGFQISANSGADDVTVDIVFPPRELAEGGRGLSKTLALMAQTFASEIVLPYLERFRQRCLVEGVTAPPAPPKGNPLQLTGKSHLPDAEFDGFSNWIRCQCRPGNALNLAQDIATARLPTLGCVRTLPVVIDETVTQQGHEITSNVTLRARKEIPKLRLLSQSERSSKWEEMLRGGSFSFSYEIASTLAEAMRSDLETSPVQNKAILFKLTRKQVVSRLQWSNTWLKAFIFGKVSASLFTSTSILAYFRMHAQFPQELIDLIITNVASAQDGDRVGDLRACRLAHSSFETPCRRHMFRKVTCRRAPGRCQDLLSFLAGCPTITTFIKQLVIIATDYDSLREFLQLYCEPVTEICLEVPACNHMPLILTSLDALTSIELSGFVLRGPLGPPLISSLLLTFQSKKIQQVILRDTVLPFPFVASILSTIPTVMISDLVVPQPRADELTRLDAAHGSESQAVLTELSIKGIIPGIMFEQSLGFNVKTLRVARSAYDGQKQQLSPLLQALRHTLEQLSIVCYPIHIDHPAIRLDDLVHLKSLEYTESINTIASHASTLLRGLSASHSLQTIRLTIVGLDAPFVLDPLNAFHRGVFTTLDYLLNSAVKRMNSDPDITIEVVAHLPPPAIQADCGLGRAYRAGWRKNSQDFEYSQKIMRCFPGLLATERLTVAYEV
ncbi:hypothetical protein DXG01_001103, partial [Tephrocybe rancida]